MKIVNCFAVMAMLASLAVELKSNPSASAQPPPNPAAPTAYVLKQIPFGALHHGQAGMPRLSLWESTTGNWAGYAVPLETSGVSDTFDAVEGNWKIPTVKGAKTAAYSSTWVGLDGYDDGTVEQVGTEQDWTGSVQANYAWFEMYPEAGYEIVGFPVDVGDLLSAEVKYLGPIEVSNVVESVFQITIKNTTKKVSFTVPTSYTTVETAARASAEWVTEAPWDEEILPLAEFSSILYYNCYASSALSEGKFEAISFWPADPLTMIDPEGGGSKPTALTVNGTEFYTIWETQ
jgi:hypothetical protein